MSIMAKLLVVEAITGVWTSGHSEELKRGITIKVGYADSPHFTNVLSVLFHWGILPLQNVQTVGKKVHFNVSSVSVDSPGHESLMANMLSGGALMDGAILVIAANEKVPQPQTREHLLALQVLGIKQIVIA